MCGREALRSYRCRGKPLHDLHGSGINEIDISKCRSNIELAAVRGYIHAPRQRRKDRTDLRFRGRIENIDAVLRRVANEEAFVDTIVGRDMRREELQRVWVVLNVGAQIPSANGRVGGQLRWLGRMVPTRRSTLKGLLRSRRMYSL